LENVAHDRLLLACECIPGYLSCFAIVQAERSQANTGSLCGRWMTAAMYKPDRVVLRFAAEKGQREKVKGKRLKATS